MTSQCPVSYTHLDVYKRQADITGITGDAIIPVKNKSLSSYDLEIVETPASPLEPLKKEGREVKAMTSSDYTASSWTTVAVSYTHLANANLSFQKQKSLLNFFKNCGFGQRP